MHKDLLKLLEEREVERHAFLHDIKTLIGEKEDDLGRVSMAVGMIGILSRLLAIRSEEKVSSKFTSELEYDLSPGVSKFFNEKIAPLVREFSRSQEERNIIFADLLEDACESLTQEFQARFLTQTIHHREQFLKDVGKLT
jgi:hypothetical protein